MNTDSIIIQKINNGDKSVFESVFKSHYKELCAYACRFELEIESAEEIVQNLFVNLWEKRESLEIHSSIRSYLFQSVRNYSLNYIKHLKVKHNYKEYNQEVISQEEQTVHDHLEEEDLNKRILKAIDELPAERKKVFLLSRFENLKYKEIAEKLDISIKTVENQMGKALKHLKESLKDYLPTLIIVFAKFFTKFFN